MSVELTVHSFVQFIESKTQEALPAILSEEREITYNGIKQMKKIKDIFAFFLCSYQQTEIYISMNEAFKKRLSQALIKCGMISHRINSAPIIDRAILDGNHAFVEILLQCNADPNERCDLDYTPLMCAAWSNQKKCVLSLLEAKAYIDAVDCKGKRALFHADVMKRDEIIELLLEKKADPQHLDNNNLLSLDSNTLPWLTEQNDSLLDFSD